MRFIILLFLISISASAQKYITDNKTGAQLEMNEVDQFLNVVRKKTNCTKFDCDWRFTLRSSVRMIDTTVYLSLKVVTNEINSVPSGGQVMIKLYNNQILKLTISDYAVASKGGGACGLIRSANWGLAFEMQLSKEDIFNLRTSELYMIRIYFSEGYNETKISGDSRYAIADQLQVISK